MTAYGWHWLANGWVSIHACFGTGDVHHHPRLLVATLDEMHSADIRQHFFSKNTSLSTYLMSFHFLNYPKYFTESLTFQPPAFVYA
jgi:hypothetical protein